MRVDPIKTLSEALRKSVAGDGSYSVGGEASLPSAGSGGKTSGEKSSATVTVPTGPFTFDYSKLEQLRKAYNAGDDAALAELLPDGTTYVYRREISDRELQKAAQEYVDEKYSYDIEKQNISADKSVSALLDSLSTAQDKAAKAENKASADFVVGTESVKDSTLKKGMLHSSVYDGLMSALADTLSAETSRIESELAAATESVNTQIGFVEQERARALRMYDFKKAEAYEKKLQSLRNEEYAQRRAVVAYNKEIAEWKKDLNTVRRDYARRILIDAAKTGTYVH